MFNEWLKKQKIKLAVQKYVYYKKEHNEWEHRYDPKDSKQEKKQSSNIIKCEDLMRQSIHRLMYLGIPAGHWYSIDTFDIKITFTDKEVWEMLEVRWNT